MSMLLLLAVMRNEVIPGLVHLGQSIFSVGKVAQVVMVPRYFAGVLLHRKLRGV